MLHVCSSQSLTVKLDISAAQKVYINIRSDTGVRLHYDIETTATIAKVKVMIQGSTGIQADKQRLLFNDKELEDDKTLADQYIGDGYLLRLSLRENGKTSMHVRMYLTFVEIPWSFVRGSSSHSFYIFLFKR